MKVGTIMTSQEKTLKAVSETAKKFEADLLGLSKELKRVQSIKCRLAKQKGKSTYAQEMTDCLAYEQVLKEARQLLDPKEKPVTHYEQADVDQLDYDETIKAIKSIQSKKTLSRWLTVDEGDNDEFRQAVKIEQMLLEHKTKIAPVDETYVRKTDIQTIIDTLESSGELTQAQVIELLKGLV